MSFKTLPSKPYVIDGDTLMIWQSGERQSLRIRWIDTPETKKDNDQVLSKYDENQWMWGQIAKDFLIKFVNQADSLIYAETGNDTYGRILIDLYANHKQITHNYQRLVCELGFATDFLPYAKSLTSAGTDDVILYKEIINRQFEAMQQKKGIWGDEDFLNPYEWRKLRRELLSQ